jgi:hypothetical protein
MDDVLEAFGFRGVMVLLVVDSARALRFGGILGIDGDKCYCNLVNWKGKERTGQDRVRRCGD